MKTAVQIGVCMTEIFKLFQEIASILLDEEFDMVQGEDYQCAPAAMLRKIDFALWEEWRLACGVTKALA